MNFNISCLRGFAILAIVLHHTLCAFYGWPPNHGIGGAPHYSLYVCEILRIFGLGVFTFISGYVLYFQNRKTDTFPCFIKKKFRRIMIPCLLYGGGVLRPIQ